MSVPHDETSFETDLQERVYYSHKLGSDPTLVLHGGGNTSVKHEEKDHTGKTIYVLRVKGSGSDLSTITEAGFTGLRMEDMSAGENIESMTDQQMVDYMKRSMVNPSEPSPSVESFLHAFIPHKFVDHSHSDAILSLTNSNLKAEDIEKILPKVIVVPYFPPGFKLAKAILSGIKKMGSDVEGIVLSQHGLFTFGSTGKESYERHIRIVRAAEEYAKSVIQGSNIFTEKFKEVPDSEILAKIPAIRGMLSKKTHKILHIENKGIGKIIARSLEAEKFAQHGPATPDMIIRTKMDYAYISEIGETEQIIDNFTKKYTEEYSKYVSEFPMHDPSPSIIVIRGFGFITSGASKKDALIIRDQFVHSMRVNSTALRIGGNHFITHKEGFEMEYWPLEEAKLKKSKPRLLQGKVSVVTGAASGIGLEVAKKLAANGSVVIACDLDPAVNEVAGSMEKETGSPVFPAVVDISDEKKVVDMFGEVVYRYGGVDILFNNAGVLKSRPIEDLPVEDLDLHYRVNSRGAFLMTREAFKIMMAQGLGGNMVFNVTKNLTNPGPGMLSYGSSKAFAAHISHYVAKEGGKYGIRSNIINPDKIFKGSKIWENGVLEARAEAKGQTVEEYKTQNLLKREVLPEHVANVVLSLVNEDIFGATTDAMIPIDGGIK